MQEIMELGTSGTVSLQALGSVENLAKKKLCEGHDNRKKHAFSFHLTVSNILENQIKYAHILRMQLGTMGH
jgi:hypothetical protein